MAIYFFTTMKRGVSSYQMAKLLGIRQKAAWYLLQRLRQALKDENEIILSGVVEADETTVGPKIHRDLRLKMAKKKHDAEQDIINGLTDEKRIKMGGAKKRGRKIGSTKEVLEQKKIERGGVPYSSKQLSARIPFEKGVIILGMAERDGRIVMKKLGTSLKDVNRTNIYPYLKKHITRNSIVITDELNVYAEIEKMFAAHYTVNHNIGYVVEGIHTNNIENGWKHLKKFIDGTYFHISNRHFSGYLNENTYRWNKREESERVLFDSFIPLVAGKRITYKKLIEKNSSKMAA